MAKYRKVDPRIWGDERFRGLSRNAQLLFFFLLTHPHMTAIGAMRATLPGLAAELRWKAREFGVAFDEIATCGMVEHDPEVALICLPNFVKYNLPESPNVVKSWAAAADLLPECPLKSRHLHRVRTVTEGLTKGFVEVLPEAFGKAMPNQEQEQEQEQEPEQEPEPEQKQDTPREGVLVGVFWEAYPRKENRREAEKAFRRLNPDRETLDLMLSWIEEAKQSAQWQDPTKIPHASTFLNQRRWEAEPPPRPHSAAPLSVEDRLRIAAEEEVGL